MRVVSGVLSCEAVEAHRQQKWAMEEAFCERTVCSILIVEERRELRIPCIVDQREFPFAQLCPGAREFSVSVLS